jgi:NADPH:quinone reductase-like Zn-dependent oxidoreductase
MLAGATAVHALTATGVSRGETILVHAAAGGVGLMVFQVGVARGAHVVGTASVSNHAYLRELGAEPTTYGEGLADRVRALAPEGVDAAIDCVGTDGAIDVTLKLAAIRDRIASIAAFPRGNQVGIKMLGGGPGADPGTDVRIAAHLQLTELVEQGQLQVRARSFALDEVAQAHREGQAGHVSGKLVLVPHASEPALRSSVASPRSRSRPCRAQAPASPTDSSLSGSSGKSSDRY